MIHENGRKSTRGGEWTNRWGNTEIVHGSKSQNENNLRLHEFNVRELLGQLSK